MVCHRVKGCGPAVVFPDADQLGGKWCVYTGNVPVSSPAMPGVMRCAGRGRGREDGVSARKMSPSSVVVLSGLRVHSTAKRGQRTGVARRGKARQGAARRSKKAERPSVGRISIGGCRYACLVFHRNKWRSKPQLALWWCNISRVRMCRRKGRVPVFGAARLGTARRYVRRKREMALEIENGSLWRGMAFPV